MMDNRKEQETGYADIHIDEQAIWAGRRYLYGLFAVVWARPVEETWLREVLSPSFLHLGETLGLSGDLRKKLYSLLTTVADPQNLSSFITRTGLDYEQLFMIPLKGRMVSLGAASYLPAQADLPRRRAVLEGWYARLGFDWRSELAGTNGVWPNEPEHAVLILTMLAILADEVCTSLDNDDGLAPALAQAGQDILDLAREWLPQCLSVIESTTRNPLYQFFASFLKEFLAQEEFTLTNHSPVPGTAGLPLEPGDSFREMF